ncbi:MAG: putative lipid II flippase FtsW [Deltaproteobacteria bacterium]|nr:putative lipid II flippase FtsW [Deltaproteobacteria bacterium]
MKTLSRLSARLAEFRPRFDLPTLCAVLFLVGLGVVMVTTASSALAAQQNHDVFFYARRQAIFALVGVVALFVGAALPSQFLKKHSYPLLITAFVLLVLVLIPGIGRVAGGARRWIEIGPISLQAGEVMKLALIVWLARSLSEKVQNGHIKTFTTGVLPHLLMPGFAVLLLLGEPDFGTSMMLLLVTFVLLFVAGARLGLLFAAVMGLVPVALHLIASSDYRMRRMLAFLDPWSHRQNIGYQITESLMTFGSGGVFGAGFGESKQKLFFLPAAHTDFVFAIVGEELGFIGVLAVLGAFALIGARALKAALRRNEPFGSYLTIGLAALLLVQMLFNVSVVLGLVPTKGITLPFVSYGGSSLVSSMFMAGILVRLIAEGVQTHEGRDRGSTGVSAGRGLTLRGGVA